MAFFATQAVVFLKIFQIQCVQHQYKKLVFFTSLFITAADIAFIGLIAEHSWSLYIPLALGGASAATLSVSAHAHIRKLFDKG